MAFSKVLGRIMSAIILTVLWIIGFGIYGIIAKLIRVRQSKTVPDTYWLPLEPLPADHWERQF
jgi:hypothetical protein